MHFLSFRIYLNTRKEESIKRNMCYFKTDKRELPAPDIH